MSVINNCMIKYRVIKCLYTQFLYRAEVGGQEKAVCAESCSDFLSFVLNSGVLQKKVFIYFLPPIS